MSQRFIERSRWKKYWSLSPPWAAASSWPGRPGAISWYSFRVGFHVYSISASPFLETKNTIAVDRKGLQSWNSNIAKAWFGGLQPGEAVGGVRVGECRWDHVTCGSGPHRGRWRISRNIRLRSVISEVVFGPIYPLIFSSGIALRLAKPLLTPLGFWSTQRHHAASLEDPPAEPHVARGNAESGSPSLQSAKEHHDGNLTT